MMEGGGVGQWGSGAVGVGEWGKGEGRGREGGVRERGVKFPCCQWVRIVHGHVSPVTGIDHGWGVVVIPGHASFVGLYGL